MWDLEDRVQMAEGCSRQNCPACNTKAARLGRIWLHARVDVRGVPRRYQNASQSSPVQATPGQARPGQASGARVKSSQVLVLVLQGVVLFCIDGQVWTLDLRPEGCDGERLYAGQPKADTKADITLTLSDNNFVQLVMGKISAQTVTVHACTACHCQQMC